MLPLGLLGDRFGRKTVLLASLCLFAAGSAACAASPSTGAFIAARLLLGLAGAGLIVMSFATCDRCSFARTSARVPSGSWRRRRSSRCRSVRFLGGWLLTHAWWGWVFLINVPVAARRP